MLFSEFVQFRTDEKPKGMKKLKSLPPARVYTVFITDYKITHMLHTAPARFSEKRKQDDSAPTPPFNTTKKNREMSPIETMSMDDDTASTETIEEETEDCDDDASMARRFCTQQKN
jgi:hypothetical protein